jgi:hypothetical protein
MEFKIILLSLLCQIILGKIFEINKLLILDKCKTDI